MDKRFFLALVLTGVVVLITPVLFPRPALPPTVATPDTTAGVTRDVPPPASGAASARDARMATADGMRDAPTPVRVDTLALTNELTTFRFSTLGASLLSADLPRFRQLGGQEGAVQLALPGEPMLGYRILAGGDTLHLSRVAFAATQDTVAGRPRVTMSGVAAAARIEVAYTLAPDNYLADVRVRAQGLPQPAFLLVDLPSGFASQEADSTEDHRHLAYAMKPVNGGAERIDFRKPDPAERMLQPGPLVWATAKSKYFLVGVLAPEEAVASPFAEMHVVGDVRQNKVATRAHGTVVAPLPEGGIAFELYAGPQEWERLVAMGRDFKDANPYGGFASGVVQPFATIVMRILLWMKRTLGIEYGWILVLFGIAVRVLMWPLNSRMMRSNMQMQRLAPEIQAAQARHKGDPEKQREAVMKVYAEHGVSPFAALPGCLPMLLPMPILFALFFVFQNTIEFRGVPFLWLSDISLKDPYYIMPLAMGLSMFALSKLSMRNVPPNPQTKMMAYLMPVIMTVALLNFASGLNVYYTVQNLAAMPQQWLIGNERGKLKAGAANGTGKAVGERKKR